MAKPRKNASPDEKQLTLQFFVGNDAIAAAVEETGGDNPFDAALRRSLGDVLEGLDRDAIARKVSELLQRPVSKAQLDQWCAPSQAGRRIHGDALIAVSLATARFGLLHCIAERLGFKALTTQEALCAEYGAQAVMERHARTRQKKIEAQMDETLLSQLLHKMQGQQQ